MNLKWKFHLIQSDLIFKTWMVWLVRMIFPLRKQIFIWFWCFVHNRTVIFSEIMSWGIRGWSFWARIRLYIFRNNRGRSSAARFGQNRLVFIIKFIFAKKFWPWFLKFDKIFIFCFVIIWFSYRFLIFIIFELFTFQNRKFYWYITYKL